MSHSQSPDSPPPEADPRPLYASSVRPFRPLQMLAATMTGAVCAVALVGGFDLGGWLGAVLAFALVLLASGLGWMIGWARLDVAVTNEAVQVHYPMSSRRIDMADITDVGPGDHVGGVGHGWGVRWQGRGRWAYRVGGPMATVVHRRGRLSLSVADPLAFVEAVAQARQQLA